MSTQQHVFDLLADVVAQEDVGTCFALLGDANMNFATRLAGHGVEMIYVRHEHCAAAAAMAHARKTGEVGFATVTCGPGLTQLMTALPAAVRARLPMVVFAGESPLNTGWYNQAIDQAPFVTATGAAYHSLHNVSRMATTLRDAFVQARMERRPVVVGVPFDLQNAARPENANLPARSVDIVPKSGPMPPNPEDLSAAVAAIESAGRIVVMAGMGAVDSDAGPACRALAEALDAPLCTTLPARGLFHDDPFSLGVAGGFSSDVARVVLGQADLILAFGTSLARHNADAGKLWPNAQVLQIDVEPVTLSQGRRAADLHLRADARLGAEALAACVSRRTSNQRTKELAERIKTEPYDAASFTIDDGTHDPRGVAAALEAALPAGWEMVNSSGHCSYYVAHMPSRPQEHFLTIREFGAIGNGISFAMGVACARPDSPVVLFDGDGSLLMHVQELETIKRHSLKVLIVVLNDGAYGSEIHKLRAEGLPDDGAVFGRTDFAAIARGFGLVGETVNDLSDIPRLVEAFAASDSATVWDIPISDHVASPVIRRAHPPQTSR